MSDILQDIFKKYKEWIIRNPQKIGDYETLIKFASYFIAGRINNSILVSEFVYSLSNLLVLFNDLLIRNGNSIVSYETKEKVKIYLTVLEYCEVFLELSSQKLWGTSGKWFVVAIIQLVKCTSKLLLIHHYKEPIVQCPTIIPLNRMLVGHVNENEGNASVGTEQERNTVTFSLRSGRTIRKIGASPLTRNWKPVEHLLPSNTLVSSLAGQQLAAETLYIVKPILHLFAVSCFGQNTWKPWVLSLLADFASLHLYSNCNKTKANCLSRDQKIQLSKRYFHLLLYLLRSPFYERYSRERLNSALDNVGKSIPLASFLTTPLQKYIPFWQSNYFYMWSN